MRTRIKICGVTRPEDARNAAQAGADAIGLVFYAASPRAVSVPQARRIIAALPPFVTTVGLFVDASPDEIEAVLRAIPLGLVQFHGDELPEQCDRYGVPYIKAVRMKEHVILSNVAAAYETASGLLLDTYRAGVPGGTGKTFDWSRVPRNLGKPVIVAGGLTPENITEAVGQTKPYAVDVSGGVESAKGIKDATKMRAFIRGVMRVNEKE